MDLQEWMHAEGLDDEEIAQRAKTHRSTISKIRRKKQRPTPELASVLIGISAGQVTWHELYGVSAPASSPSPVEEAA